MRHRISTKFDMLVFEYLVSQQIPKGVIFVLERIGSIMSVRLSSPLNGQWLGLNLFFLGKIHIFLINYKIMEIKAEKLLPIILDFAKQYLDKKDFKKLMEKFDGDSDYESDELLKKTGGLKGLL